jgi:hypothetical protein
MSGGKHDDDDDVYLRLQHGKGLHNLVYISYVGHEGSGLEGMGGVSVDMRGVIVV